MFKLALAIFVVFLFLWCPGTVEAFTCYPVSSCSPNSCKAKEVCYQDYVCDVKGCSYRHVCCVKEVKPTDLTPDCTLPMDAGPCYAYNQRFYFNQTTKSCEEFAYGGCYGNSNNFETIQSCQKTCQPNAVTETLSPSTKLQTCQQPKVEGRCTALFFRFYYDWKSGICKDFVYGGCQGNDNNFETFEQCQETCVAAKQKVKPTDLTPDCTLPMDAGPCYAYNQRFYFNQTTKSCEEFAYGGCYGNSNNFETIQSCQKTCQPNAVTEVKPTDLTPDCTLRMDVGPCYAYNQRFYFNQTTKSCEEFAYGGCYGNSNNFETIQSCQKTCQPNAVTETPSASTKLPTCQQPKVEGRCLASFPRFYYDSQSGICKDFVYGGCQGNENNFKTFEQCQETCVAAKQMPKAVCQIQADPSSGHNVTGTIVFYQQATPARLLMGVDIQRLPYISDNNNGVPEFGIHVHAYGNLAGGCASTGPLYNPDRLARHVGDFGNFKAQYGKTWIFTSASDYMTSLLGPQSIIGRSVAIHSRQNYMGKGFMASNQVNGDSGPIVACCVISWAN